MRHRRQRGQATPEWLGLVLVVALAFAAMVAASPVPGSSLASAIANRLICAVGLGEGCGGVPGPLVLAYGRELASLVTRHTPTLEYEPGMRALPVDFRSCRDDACAEGVGEGRVERSLAGEPVTAFTHVVACGEEAVSAESGFDCTGERSGNTYVQFWLYYPGSHSSRHLYGAAGYHDDDWESFTVRVGTEGTDARASSHQGYNGYSGDPLSDAGIIPKSGWVSATGRYWIAGGSHAGKVGRRGPRPDSSGRWTPGSAIHLVPIESLADSWQDFEFEVTPPWLKDVYRDPENRGT